MDEPFLPWWLVILLGMWVIAMSIWQRSGLHREVRLWAGLAALIYVGLIFLALGLGSQSDSLASTFNFSSVVLIFSMAIGIAAGLWGIGRCSTTSRRLSYVVLTCANACYCFQRDATIPAVGLLIVACWSSQPLLTQWRRSGFRRSRAWFFRFLTCEESSRPVRIDESILGAILTGVVACVLIGTLAYSTRIETSRLTRSPRHTALPSREQLERIQLQKTESGPPSLVDLVFSQRADLIVLLSVLVLLSLASQLGHPLRSRRLQQILEDPGASAIKGGTSE